MYESPQTRNSLERQINVIVQSQTFLKRARTKRGQIIESIRELQGKVFSIENIDVKLAEGIAQKIDNQIKDASLVIHDLESSLEEATKNSFF